MDINDISGNDTMVGQTYQDGDNEIYIIAKAMKHHMSDKTGDSVITVELAKCTDMVKLWWIVAETDKDGDVVKSDEYDNEENAVVSYLERAFGVSV